MCRIPNSEYGDMLMLTSIEGTLSGIILDPNGHINECVVRAVAGRDEFFEVPPIHKRVV
jgi:hypothetical protein